MILGLSTGETAVLLVAAVAIFGPKDIALGARIAGKLAGRAAGYLSNARNAINSFSEKSKINQLHAELSETLSQVEAIKQQLRSGMFLSSAPPIPSKLGTEIKPAEKVGEVKSLKNSVQNTVVERTLPILDHTKRKIRPLPISAVSAGIIPQKRNVDGGGSLLLFDALMEERVAKDAMKFSKLEELTGSEPKVLKEVKEE